MNVSVVVWDDAWGSATIDYSPADVEAHHKPQVIQTLGWILKEDDLGVMIAAERTEEGHRGVSFIPRPMIRSVNHFSLAKPRAKKPPKPRVPPVSPLADDSL